MGYLRVRFGARRSCARRGEKAKISLPFAAFAGPARPKPRDPPVGGLSRDTARAMSQENVEVVRASFEAWNAGDMDAFRELYDPGVILRTVEGWPEPGPYVGREAVMRLFEQNRVTWDANAVEPIGDFID